MPLTALAPLSLCLAIDSADSSPPSLSTAPMDTPTHMLLGGAAAYAVFGRSVGRRAAVAGALAALLPDLDIFLAPLGDPALTYELHRHFTHAFILAPLFGVLGAAPLLLWRSGRAQSGRLIAAGIAGALTHGLLDQLTSYGTHLWWPFISHRTAWDAMSIIDPIMTCSLLIGLVIALLMRTPWPAAAGLLIALLYTGFGFMQRERARAVQQQIAVQRGDTIEHGRVMPTLGNIILWRSLYRTPDGTMHADAVRLPIGGAITIREGTGEQSVARLDEHLPQGSDAYDRLQRFLAFADGFASVRRGPSAGTLILYDERFSMDTADFVPLWGVAFDPNLPEDPDALFWTTNTSVRRESLAPLLAEILGRPRVEP